MSYPLGLGPQLLVHCICRVWGYTLVLMAQVLGHPVLGVWLLSTHLPEQHGLLPQQCLAMCRAPECSTDNQVPHQREPLSSKAVGSHLFNQVRQLHLVQWVRLVHPLHRQVLMVCLMLMVLLALVLALLGSRQGGSRDLQCPLNLLRRICLGRQVVQASGILDVRHLQGVEPAPQPLQHMLCQCTNNSNNNQSVVLLPQH
mmetsp:Transcript_66388/g.167320  ORF Transcript_66388/g.167320 Transcript_66388/m.167320 type:complete len:200 (-) Transcript_66388:2469-3068(-)